MSSHSPFPTVDFYSYVRLGAERVGKSFKINEVTFFSIIAK